MLCRLPNSVGSRGISSSFCHCSLKEFLVGTETGNLLGREAETCHPQLVTNGNKWITIVCLCFDLHLRDQVRQEVECPSLAGSSIGPGIFNLVSPGYRREDL